MSKELTKETVAAHKKAAIGKLDNLLRKYIYSGDEKQLKKANLISYWLENFSNYVSFEEQFDPTRIINYSRGNVIRLNFGFNIGKEFGGLHYAVVLDNDSKHRSEVITVVPLSSTDGKQVHPNSVDLGSELYEKASVRQKNLRESIQRDMEQVDKLLDITDTTLKVFHENSAKLPPELPSNLTKSLDELIEAKKILDPLKVELQNQMRTITKNDEEVKKMKVGSMAVTNQITTVSKQRIYVPKRAEDFLYDISLSPSAMDKINQKLKELYFFE